MMDKPVLIDLGAGLKHLKLALGNWDQGLKGIGQRIV
jgi:hypothetical protein